MKRVSKILSLAIMCALVMAPMTVFAEDQTVTTNQTVTATVSTASGESGSESSETFRPVPLKTKDPEFESWPCHL